MNDDYLIDVEASNRDKQVLIQDIIRVIKSEEYPNAHNKITKISMMLEEKGLI